MREERRQHSRVKRNLTARIQRNSRLFDGIIRDVSDSGVFLRCNRKLLPGERVRIAVEPKDCMSMVFDVEVVWSRIFGQDEPGGLYGIGFRFLDMCV
jgi:hypothetical protein